MTVDAVVPSGTWVTIPSSGFSYLQYAITSLRGTVLLTMHFIDPRTPDVGVTIDHEFTDEPVLTVLDTDMFAGSLPR